METTVNNFYARFNNSETIEDKKQVAAEFRVFYEGLDAENKTIARNAMQPILDETKASFEILDVKAKQFEIFRKVA
jgi:hypothetical protein